VALAPDGGARSLAELAEPLTTPPILTSTGELLVASAGILFCAKPTSAT
jgi:hypothetical protein